MQRTPFHLRIAASCLMASLATAAVAKDIAITDAQIEGLKITLETVKAATTDAVAVLPATVIPPPNGRVAVAAPFAGTIVKSEVLPGQQVTQGQPLVKIASRDLMETISRLRQSEADLQAAEAVAERYRILAERKIAAQNRADETAAQADKVKAMVHQLKHVTTISNIEVNDDGTLLLRAPAAGRIVEVRTASGASVEAMAAAAVIDTSDELWLQAQVPAAFVGRIRQGDTVVVGEGTIGHVESVGATLDPMTRSAVMLVRLPKGVELVSGQMVTLTVTREARMGSLSVPTRAVAWIDGTPSVFVRKPGGFEIKPVKIRGSGPQTSSIEGEIQAGQTIAASGLAQLEKMGAGE